MSEAKARLTRFFDHYAKDKLGSVDQILDKYTGRETELFATLEKRYGPESAVGGGSAPATPDYRGRLLRFFEHYNPEKLGTVDAILEKYAGREAELFQLLVGKYGVEPPAATAPSPPSSPRGATSSKSRLVRFFEQYNPERLPAVDQILEQYAGREADLFAALTKKYGPEPGDGAAAPASPASPRAADFDTKARLTRFFEQYNPEKLASVDQILTQYAGKEADLFAALVKKYGPEPAAPASPTAPAGAAAVAGSASPSTRDRLIQFFQQYNPEKLSSVDQILTQYAGKETDLFAALVKKYGPEPGAAAPTTLAAPDARSRLIRFFEKYNAEKLSSVDQILQQYAGKEAELFAALVKKYGPEPTGPSALTGAGGQDAKSRLIRFFQKYNAEKLSAVDQILQQYAGKEADLFAALVKKYGPEPAASGEAASLTNDPRSRLVRFFEQYNQEKLSSVDQILTQYAGKENDLFAALVKKYGPEPAARTAGSGAPAAGAATAKAQASSLQSLLQEVDGVDVLLQLPPDRLATLFAQSEYGRTLFRDYIRKHRSAGPTQPASAGAPQAVVTDSKSRLIRFFEQYNKDKVGSVDQILQQYAGKEAELFAALVKKYGPEPSGVAPTSVGTDPKSRLLRFFGQYNREKLPAVDQILQQYAGKENELFVALVKKYGPEPEINAAAPVAAVADHKSRLIRFFEQYNKEKLGSVDQVLTQYAGKEADLFSALVKKYGPEPSVAGPSSSGVAAAPSPASAPLPQGTDTRARLVRFFEQYNKEKIPAVDQILSQYAGKEIELFAALVKKYGPEPANAPGAPAPSGHGDARSRLVRFFEQYNKEKLSSVDQILTQYAGKEADLFAALVKKYGPEPGAAGTGGATARERLVRFFEMYNKEKLSSVDQILTQYAGKEADLFAALVKKYGPEPPAAAAPSPPAAPSEPRARLIRFFEQYNKEKLSSVDLILAQYAGKEADLFSALVKKYGPEPGAPTATPHASVTPMGFPTDAKSRLIRFFEKYNKEKLGSVDQILTQYAGKENDLFAALVKKYGPEPVAPVSTTANTTSDVRTRLVRFFEKYNAEKISAIDQILQQFAGKETDLFAALVKKYGPEPEEAVPTPQQPVPVLPKAPADNPSLATEVPKPPTPQAEVPDIPPWTLRRKVHEWLAATKLSPADALKTILSTELEAEKFVCRYVAGPSNENRLARLVSKRCPEKLEEVERQVLAASEESRESVAFRILRAIVIDHGDEPLSAVPSKEKKLVQLSTIPKKDRVEDEELVVEETAAVATPPPEVKDPSPLREARQLVEDAEKADPGECSGDDEKTYPREREHWVRFTFRQVAANAEEAELIQEESLARRGRTFTEFRAGGADDDDDDDARSNASGGGRDMSPTLPPPDAPSFSMDPRARLVRFFAKYNRDKLANVDAILANYAAKETELFEALVAKYGPEPSPDDPDVAHSDEPMVTVAVLASAKGVDAGKLCTSCSNTVVKGFDALWTPVGPRHRQILASAATKEGWLEKLSGGRFGNKWQRRFFRISDKGLHYYETDKPGEKPKGHKFFTTDSIVVANFDPVKYPKCADRAFHHFAVTVNATGEIFFLRATRKDDKADWLEFLKSALARLRISMVGQDTNPGRWRARLAGLRAATASLTEATHVELVKQATAEKRRDELKKQVQQAEFENGFLRMQKEDLAAQKEELRRMVQEAEAQCAKVEKECDERVLNAAEEAGKLVSQQSDIHAKIQTAKDNTGRLKLEVQELHCLIVDKQEEKRRAEVKKSQIYEKWRHCEEREPQTSLRRARHGSGLAYRPKETERS